MLGVKPPLWSQILLHGTLVFFALIFSFPFIWMLGTSFKQDKELSASRLSFMPRPPNPEPISPYIDSRQFDPIKMPDESVQEAEWETLKDTVTVAIDESLRPWVPPEKSRVTRDQALPEMRQGVWHLLQGKLPVKFWTMKPGEAADKSVRELITPEMIDEAFDLCHRRFMLSTITIRTKDYSEHKAEPVNADPTPWSIVSGSAELTPVKQIQQTAYLVRYDLSGNGELHLSAEYQSPVPLEDIKHIRVSYRQDETWHRVYYEIEMNGRLYKPDEPNYQGYDDWVEVTLQHPSEDDRRLMAKTWILIRQGEKQAGLENRPGHFKVHCKIVRSGMARAWWGKMRNNYQATLKQVPFWRYVSTSICLAILRISLTLFSCSVVAYSFSRLDWPGRSICFTILLATLMIPGQVTMIPQFIIFKSLGWYNTLFPLWVTSIFGGAFFIFLLRQFMKGIPKDLEDAALIDGCGYFRIYWHVILPNIKPALAAIAIFTFLGSWNDFMGPLIYVNDQRMYNLALGLFSFRLESGAAFGMLMAGSLIMTTPIIVIFFFAQRYFIQGVTLTGIKG
ncbi:MAG TPA: ABC transporter permease subunit [Candidatus Brocadiia bacterium]|nr:ABC transporter permease subunit [Candidatus Brocadiia bacterium]